MRASDIGKMIAKDKISSMRGKAKSGMSHSQQEAAVQWHDFNFPPKTAMYHASVDDVPEGESTKPAKLGVWGFWVLPVWYLINVIDNLILIYADSEENRLWPRALYSICNIAFIAPIIALSHGAYHKSIIKKKRYLKAWIFVATELALCSVLAILGPYMGMNGLVTLTADKYDIAESGFWTWVIIFESTIALIGAARSILMIIFLWKAK